MILIHAWIWEPEGSGTKSVALEPAIFTII